MSSRWERYESMPAGSCAKVEWWLEVLERKEERYEVGLKEELGRDRRASERMTMRKREM